MIKMCRDLKKHRDTTIIRADSKTKKGKVHACLTLLIAIINNSILMVFYMERHVRKQLLDDPLHLNAEVIGQKLHGPGLHGHPF